MLVGTIQGVDLPKMELLKGAFDFPKEFKFPLIIKPNTMGSSIGVTIANTVEDYKKQIALFHVSFPLQEIIVQEYLKGAIEIQCGTLEKKDGQFISIPPIEIIPQKNAFFDYDSKYLVGGATEITPPQSIST